MILSGQIYVLFCKNEREFDRFLFYLFLLNNLFTNPLFILFLTAFIMHSIKKTHLMCKLLTQIKE